MASDIEWRPIPGLEEHYEASSEGDVRSVRTGRVRKGTDNGYGYLVMRLSVNGKTRMERVNRLIATTFLDPVPGATDVCHNNGRRWDNHASNLRWDDHRSNMADVRDHRPLRDGAKCAHGHRDAGWVRSGTSGPCVRLETAAKAEARAVRDAAIREARAAGEPSVRLAAKHGLTPQTIWRITMGGKRQHAASTN